MADQLQHTIKAVVRRGEQFYVAECLEIAVVTQGRTFDETLDNLREAVMLHLDGSHVKLARVTADGTRQVLTVPAHKELDKATILAILRQASRFVDPNLLRQSFYSD